MTTETDNIPPGYVNHGDLFGDLNFDRVPEWRWLLYANLLALVPLGVAALLLWLPYQFYIALGAPLALAEPKFTPEITALLGICIVVFSVFAHEGLHGLALRLLGYHPRMTYSRGFLVATVTGFITRRDYLIMILTPITVESLVGGLLLLWLPVSLGQWLVAALLLNAAASVSDLAVAARVLRLPADALFADTGSITVYLRELHRKS